MQIKTARQKTKMPGETAPSFWTRVFSLIKFSASSLITTLIDLGLFTLVNMLTANLIPDSIRLLAATAFARVISCALNYLANRKLVFKDQGSTKVTMIRYTIMAIVQAVLSYNLVYLTTWLFDAEPGMQTVLKMFVDVLLFFFAYFAQKHWVFPKQKDNDNMNDQE